eukprot:Sspe_Gene.49370::Locus_26558_Transcript_3_4_Confidence_0.455_Length_388::g.49370::m.49370
MLFIRDTRLQNIGEFASVLLHCLGHIKAGTIAEGCNDASPAFMYEYHGLLELLAEEMFYVKSKKAIPRPNLPRQHFRMNAVCPPLRHPHHIISSVIHFLHLSFHGGQGSQRDMGGYSSP